MTNNQAKDTEDSSIAQLTAYSAPAVPLSMLWAPIVIWLPAFYTQDMGLNLAIAGIIFLVARLWDGISDPIMGVLSDRVKLALGRRKPWMLIGSVFLIVATYRLFVPSQGAGAGYLMTWIILFYMFWTVVQVPYMAWGADLSTSYRGRGRVVGYRSVGSMVGILLASLLPLMFFGKSATPEKVLHLYAICLLLLLPVCTIWAAAATSERPARETSDLPWKSLMLIVWNNKPFMRFLLAFFLWDLALAMVEVAMLFIVERSLELKGYFPLLFAIDYCTAILMTPAIVLVATRFGKHRAFALSGIAFVISCLILLNTAPGDLVMAALGYAFMGVAISGFWAIPTSLVADATDLGLMRGGGDQTGLYMALFNITWKFAMASGVSIGLVLLQLLGFDAATDAENSGLALQSLKIVGLMLPILFIIPSCLIMWNYPITERKHLIIRRVIERNRIKSK